MKFFYPPNLPITDIKNEIIETIRDNQVTIVSGDTGSGKTTQLPKMCLQALSDQRLLIGCTQPRRIAASSVAARVAEEIRDPNLVGYKIRFHDYTTPKTRIKFMTDGVLLAETRHDRLLSGYGVLIIDEAHERSLNIDFLLGYLKKLVVQRPELKILITSATIDTAKFSHHFHGAPILSVAGRAFPVSVEYRPPADEGSEDDENLLEHCISTTVELCSTHPDGDILIFLPTEKDILECCKQLRAKLKTTTVLPLYGRLPVGEQKRIFQSSSSLKVVVATNVAETSITVPGIRYVIDSGTARISHYNVRAKTTALPISKISRASCDQRKGRCGRVGPGLCIRLYSEEDYNNRDEFTLPEIKRSNLAEVILQMIALDFGDPSSFPFLEPPFKNTVREGYRLLRELGAISEKNKLTRRGKMMAKLPIDPCISRILLEANQNNCLREITIIAAVLAIQDPRVRPPEQQNKADLAHKSFAHPHSDFLAILNIWNGFHDVETEKISWSRLKKFCQKNYLSFQRMREWLDLHGQLSRILALDRTFHENSEDGTYEDIHKSLMSGFLRNLAVKKQAKIYQGAHNKELMIFPGSHLFANSGQWIMAATFIETNRLYGMTVATIEPEWAEQLGRHLCKYSWSEPHYQKKRGQIIATEKVSLFGLPIVTGRKVTYGKQNEAACREARDIFINDALLTGDLTGNYSFLNHNLSLLAKWKNTEEKLRIRNVLVDDTTIFDFYDRTLPQDVYDRPSLNRHLKRNRVANRELRLSENDILLRRPEDRELIDYPPTCNIGRITIELTYSFSPGADEDGVTFHLPLEYAMGANPALFEWLVPGLLQEKLTYMLKGLPKQVRKKLVPVNETVQLLLDKLEFRSGSLINSLEKTLFKHCNVLIAHSDWPVEFPPHLVPRFSIFNQADEVLSEGRDLQKLLGRLDSTVIDMEAEPQLSDISLQLQQQWSGSEHRSWDFHELPLTLPIQTTGGSITGFLYAALQANTETQCVTVIFTKTHRDAEQQTLQGNLYLFWLQFLPQYKSLKKHLKTNLTAPSTSILSKLEIPRPQLIEELLDYVLLTLLGFEPKHILKKDEFESTVKHLKSINLYVTTQQICNDIISLYRKRKEIETTVKKLFSSLAKKKHLLPDKESFFRDLLEQLFPADFFRKSSKMAVRDIDRQLQCLKIRLERFLANPAKDLAKNELLQPYVDQLQVLESRREHLPEEAIIELDIFKEMVDEYRISLFSQEIKTKMSISPKKLSRQLSIAQAKS